MYDFRKSMSIGWFCFVTDTDHNFRCYLPSVGQIVFSELEKKNKWCWIEFSEKKFKNKYCIYFSVVLQVPKMPIILEIIHIPHITSMNNFKQDIWQNRGRVETDNINCFICISANCSYIFQSHCWKMNTFTVENLEHVGKQKKEIKIIRNLTT